MVGDTFHKYSKNSQCLQYHVPFCPVNNIGHEKHCGSAIISLKVCPASLWTIEPSHPGALPCASGCGQTF